MKYKLQDLIDIKLFQSLQDRFSKIYSFPSAIIDNDGVILTASNWQDVCTQFHRVNPESEKECIISDQYILDHINEANPSISYKCAHGLIDTATPIIIDGIHYGNFFLGQFFFEKPDLNIFKEQAKKYNFDEEAYLEAIKRVPIWTKEQLDSYLIFIKGLIEVISGIGLKNLREIEAKKALEKSESLYHDLVETAQDLIWQCDAEGRYTYINPEWENVFGYKLEEMLGKKFSDFQTKEWAERDLKEFDRLLKGNIVRGLETVHIAKDGKEINLIFNAKFVYDGDGNIAGTRGTAYNITESKKAVEELQKSEVRFRTAFDNSAIGICLTSPEGKFLQVNSKICKILGYTKEELLNISFQEITYPDDIAKSNNTVLSAINIQQTDIGHFVKRYIKKNGEFIWAEVSSSLLRDDSDNPLYFITHVVDITEHKKTEEALKRSEYILNEAQKISKIGGWEYDVESGETYFSDMVFNIYGLLKNKMFKPEEGIEFYHPDDRPLVSNSFTKAITEGIPYDIEVRFINSHGKNMWVRTVGKPVSKNGKCVKILGNIMDITERKLSEARLVESNKRYKALVCVSNTGAWEYNVDTKFLWCSPEYFSMLGRNRSQFNPSNLSNLNETWIDLLHPDDREKASSHFADYLKNGSVGMYENYFRMQHSDGHWVWILSRGSTLRDENEKITNLTVGTHIDITKQKLAQEKIKESHAQLLKAEKIAHFGLLDWNLQTNKLFLSDEVYRIYGLSKTSQLVDAEIITNGVHPDDRDFIAKQLEAAINENKNFNVDHRVLRPSGEIVWVHSQGELSRNVSGKPIKFLGTIIEITERKKVEEKLALERYHQQIIMDTAPYLIWFKDNKNNFIRVNKAAANIAQKSVSEIEGKHADEIFPIESAKYYQDDLEVINSGAPKIGIIEQVTIKNISRWVKTDKIPWYDDKGEIAGVVAYALDITDLKKAEEAISQSEQHLSSIFNTVKDIIFLITVEADNQYRFISVNPAFKTVTGLPKEAVMGKLVSEVIPEPALSRVLGKYKQAIEEKTMVGWVEISNYPAGQLIGSVNVSPIIDEHGHCKFLVGSVHDITELKHAEEKIKKLNQELEQRVKERTAELENVTIDLESKNAELSRFNKLFVGRELRIKELRDKIAALELKLQFKRGNR